MQERIESEADRAGEIGACIFHVIVMKISNSRLLQHIFVYSGVFTRDDFERSREIAVTEYSETAISPIAGERPK